MSERKTIAKRIFAAAVAGALTLSFAMSGCAIFQTGETSDGESKPSQGSGSSEKALDGAAVSSENFSMSLPIMEYLFNYNYLQYAQYAVYYYGLDQTKPLTEQYYDEQNGVTWYDYFMDMTKTYARQLLVLAEAAHADGLELDETDLANVESSLLSMEETAKQQGKTLDEYIASNFSAGVTKADVEECLKLTALAQKYYDKTYNGFEYTDEEYEDYYKEHATDYQYADFLKFSFSFADSEGNPDDALKTAAKKSADELQACKTVEEFQTYIRTYLTKHKESPEAAIRTANADAEITEDSLREEVEKEVTAALSTGYAYEVSSDAGQWVFASDRKELDTNSFENSDSYTVIMIVKTAYRNESIYKNVRHILFTTDADSTDDAAKTQAEKTAKEQADKVYQEWKDGDATEDSFAELAGVYSQDPGSASKGGLYENVYEGQMVPEFNDWVFDPDRKVGDTGIVKTSYGYHIMYFSGNSKPAWKVSVDTVLRRSAFDEHYQELSEKYTVEFNDELLAHIEVNEKTDTE